MSCNIEVDKEELKTNNNNKEIDDGIHVIGKISRKEKKKKEKEERWSRMTKLFPENYILAYEKFGKKILLCALGVFIYLLLVIFIPALDTPLTLIVPSIFPFLICGLIMIKSEYKEPLNNIGKALFIYGIANLLFFIIDQMPIPFILRSYRSLGFFIEPLYVWIPILVVSLLIVFKTRAKFMQAQK